MVKNERISEKGKSKNKNVTGSGDSRSIKDSITVQPEKILFIDNVFYSVKKMPADIKKELFPKPYYRIKKKRAIAIYGNYVEDLFTLKQQTILKAKTRI